MVQDILLTGHRGSGKSTLGSLLARHLRAQFTDLDSEISARTGKTPAELVTTDEENFRLLEKDTLRDLMNGTTPRVISVGGGLLDVPHGILTIWIDREGWEETAREERHRLRPGIAFEEELTWMKETREPLYALNSHYRLHIERECSAEDAAERLITIVDWFRQAARSPAFRKTWIVPPTKALMERCFADASLFGLAGVEVRSDLIPDLPDTDKSWLASLRTDDPDFFRNASGASAFDCDIQYIDDLNLENLAPRPLMLSTHPTEVDKEFFDELLTAAIKTAERYPEWRPYIQRKYAPIVKSWIELRYGHEMCRVQLKKGQRVSFLPQGKKWRWVRAFRLWNLNELNYASPGSESFGNAPPTLAYFLPHAVGPSPEEICAVIGDPVEQSIGDVWHRKASLLLDGGKIGYLKIPLTPDELELALYFLLKLNFKGLSVTSPLKKLLVQSNFVANRKGLEAGNTLTLRDGAWVLTDTDSDGMAASLDVIEAHGISPGGVAIFGRGGVSASLVKALRKKGWNPVEVVSAREGWGRLSEKEFQLVIDASGPKGSDARVNPPRSSAWLDLQYRDLKKKPEGLSFYMNGMTFYNAQATAQRKEWDLPAANPEIQTDPKKGI